MRAVLFILKLGLKILAAPLVLALALWMTLTRRGRQAASVTWVGVSTLPQRLGSSSVVATMANCPVLVQACASAS